MKIKKYIQENLKEFEYDEDLNPVWDKLSRDMASSNDGPRIKLLIGFFILVFLLVGAFIYLTNTKETKIQSEPQASLYASLKSNKTSDKILAIHDVSQFRELDDDIAMVLVQTLKEDESINVKMSAVKALHKYMDIESVRIAVIEELESADNAYLQIKLINLLKKAKVKESLDVLDKIIKDRDGHLQKEAVIGKGEILSI